MTIWQDIKNIYHLLQAVIANITNGFPSRGMTIIGVTGTDGKTTTATIIYHVLSLAGKKVALISSVAALINGKSFDTGFHVTTPDPADVQKYIKKAKKAGVKYLVLETTSIGLHQNRVFGVPFHIGVLTNITNEHLDYHKSYPSLVKAKARLFKKAKIAVLNADDKSLDFILPYIRSKKIITYGIRKNSMLNPVIFPFKSKLIGKFNQYNVLAAIASLRELNIDDNVIREGISSFIAPQGREEVVYDDGFTVVIDFAHTPGSFLAVLPEVKKISSGRLIHVFGSAGQRDRYKRPQMGKITSTYADIVILTAEDPRSEKIEDINQQIEEGIIPKFNKKNLFKISDRQEAISRAVELAREGDIIIITGKAHEKSMNYGKGEIHWSDHEAVKKALVNLKK